MDYPFKINIDFYRLLVERSLKEMSFLYNKQNMLNVFNYKDENSYNFNSYGYRSPEFDKDNKILFLGCSQTFGYGLPTKYRWTEMIAEKSKLSFSTIATPGDSAMGQVNKAFRYFKEIGNPEVIFASLPYDRFEIPLTKDKLEDSYGNYDIILQLLSPELKKFSKAPHNPQDIMTKEVGLFITHSYINILIQYCKSNNIKLFWNIWQSDYQYGDVYNLMNDKFDTYVHCEDAMEKSCHSEYADNKYFYYASDHDPKNNSFGHWGIHRHIHMAEDFYKKYIESL